MTGWNRGRNDDNDLQEEIRAHLAIAADDKVAGGQDRRSAEFASRKDFGNVAHTQAAVREVWSPRWLEALRDIGRDARLAVRLLRKNPAFSLTVIAVLTIGIVLNTTVFTLLKSLALSPLGGVDRSISLKVVLNETVGGRQSGLSYPDYKHIRDNSHAFSGLLGVAMVNASVGTGSRAEIAVTEFVTGNYFDVLGVSAQLGRTLNANDEIAPGQHPVAVLSDAVWRRKFDADPAIVGQTIHLNTFPLTVVGVAEPEFHGTIVSFDVEVFVPLMMMAQVDTLRPRTGNDVLGDSNESFLLTMGRLKPGVAASEAGAELALLSQQLDDDDPADAVAQELKVVPIWRSPFGAQTYMLPAVTVLLMMGGLLLLVACANVAGLVLARGVSRRGEIALRLALGASRRRIIRLLLVENTLLALPAAVLTALVVPRVLPSLMAGIAAAAPVRIFLNVSVDYLVLGFSMLAAIASAFAFGLFPAMQSSRVELQSAINEDLSPRGGAKGRFRGALVAAQVAVSLLLLIGAGLVTRSVEAARNADAGFDRDNVLSARLGLAANGYDQARGLEFYEALLDRLRNDSGVESATVAATAPLSLVDDGERSVRVENYAPLKDEDLTFLSTTIASDYFKTLRINFLAGRDFRRADDGSAPLVVVVNETMARRFWGSPEQALGKRISVSSKDWRTVVGVARDVKYSRINEAPRPYVYMPLAQAYESSMLVYVRSTLPTAAVADRLRTHVTALDAELPTLSTRTLRNTAEASLAFLVLAARMLFIFGIAGMALAAMGLYGLVAYTVRQSTHEIGIRMALGAHGRSIIATFLTRGLRLGAIGAVFGIVAAIAVTRLLGSVLYGVRATDPASFVTALVILLTIVGLATLVPAWRASRTNVLTALRHQ